jgi:hypothetical protein
MPTGLTQALEVAEVLTEREANTAWQTDVAVSCSKLGTLDEHCQSVAAPRGYLLRGREILLRLKSAGRLMANRDWIQRFDEELAKLAGGQ